MRKGTGVLITIALLAFLTGFSIRSASPDTVDFGTPETKEASAEADGSFVEDPGSGAKETGDEARMAETDVEGETAETGEEAGADETDGPDSTVETEDGQDDKSGSRAAETESGEAEGTENAEKNAPFRSPNAPEAIKGLYISAWAAGTKDILEENFLKPMEGTELNTIVIDVKDDEGRVVFRTDSPLVTETEAVRVAIGDMPGLLSELHSRGYYIIGRLVAFRDPYIRETKEEWVLKNPDGSVYTDEKNNSWLDPTNSEACSYLLEVAEDCADAGIDEIQFDYVRYPSAVTDEMAGCDGQGRKDAITAFAKLAKTRFREIGIPFSLDVFGTVIHSPSDQDIIGQDYYSLALAADAISPMVYPSHYADGTFGIEYPDLEPGETVYQSLMKSNHLLEGENVTVRPWLQDFTANYLEHYRECGPAEVREQIEAVYRCGMTEWLIWDPTGHYSWDAFLKE